MNNESQKVDVLAVIADIWHQGLVGENVHDFERAMVAIAELISTMKWINEIGGCGATVHRRIESVLARIGAKP